MRFQSSWNSFFCQLALSGLPCTLRFNALPISTLVVPSTTLSSTRRIAGTFFRKGSGRSSTASLPKRSSLYLSVSLPSRSISRSTVSAYTMSRASSLLNDTSSKPAYSGSSLSAGTHVLAKNASLMTIGRSRRSVSMSFCRLSANLS